MSERAKKWSIATLATVLSLIASVASAVWITAARDKSNSMRLETLEKSEADHEARMRLVESSMTEIRSDTKWIKSWLEQSASSRPK
jgi:hypothetical protein